MNTLPLRVIEEALASGLLEAKNMRGNWLRVRRNGATKVWKTSERFRIPVKAGFSSTGAITEASEFGDMGNFRVNHAPGEKL